MGESIFWASDAVLIAGAAVFAVASLILELYVRKEASSFIYIIVTGYFALGFLEFVGMGFFSRFPDQLALGLIALAALLTLLLPFVALLLLLGLVRYGRQGISRLRGMEAYVVGVLLFNAFQAWGFLQALAGA